MANSIQIFLKRRFRIPFRLSGALGLLQHTLAPWIAARQDKHGRGEALLATFQRRQ